MRGVDEAHDLAVDEEADGHAGGAEEAVELDRGRIVPVAGQGLGGVEVEVGRQVPDEHDVARPGAALGRGVIGAGRRSEARGGGGRGGVRELDLAQGQGGADELAALGAVAAEVLGERLAGVEEVGGEFEEFGEEAGEVLDAAAVGLADGRLAGHGVAGGGGCTAGLVREGRGEFPEELLQRGRMALHALGVEEDGHGHDEPVDGLHHAEPGLVEPGLEVGRG